MRFRVGYLALALVGVVSLTTIVSAASTSQPSVTARPVAPAPKGQFDQQTLHIESRSAAASQPSSAAVSSTDTPNSFDARRVAMALGAVIALILLLRWLAKNLFAGASAPRATAAMRVISRMVVSPKQQVLLLQVGKRIIVVGDSGQQMSALAEISDADEIASLVGQIGHDQARSAGGRTFGSLFGKARDPFDEPAVGLRAEADREDAADPQVATARGEIDGLADKIRLLSAQFRRT